MQRYERIKKRDIDLLAADLVAHLLHQRLINLQVGVAFRNAQWEFVARRAPEPAFQLCLRDALVLADGRDAPVYFLRVVLSVVVPAFQPLSRLLAEQAARSCHGDGLDQVLAALSHSA